MTKAVTFYSTVIEDLEYIIQFVEEIATNLFLRKNIVYRSKRK